MKQIQDFLERKKLKQKISMITCYDSWSAKIISETQIDCVLVGDSLGMVMHGHTSTLPVSTAVMALHTAAVARGLKNKFLVADLPFLSYRKDLRSSVSAAEKVMKAGAQAVKLEGARGNLELIAHLVDSGVPVMGHLGLTPQSIHQLGGFKVQAKLEEEQSKLLKDCLALEKAGCFAVVLECVPQTIARKISESLSIPTIGIGAGVGCDGQVLVLHDLLGLQNDFHPKFLRKYMQGFEMVQEALNHFHRDVVAEKFPTDKESY